ncbi:MAG: cytochrome c oxidase subunit I [uncultured Microvirga sp.]|uniref:Cytochrome c oxidase subunit I n=1 Tax=uncultured Microvirga sp. TaxID=412392 RepID=A0A6J4LIB9_9HYPH|nr:MAG: cytochrome c oxidase subunit I [uncultured Microvirga sp.]
MADVRVLASSGDPLIQPKLRRIGSADLRAALAQGVDDFRAMPSHLVFVGLLYPIVGILLAALTFGYDLLPLLFPLVSGFALVGPLAAIGLYELSRRRESGEDTSWRHAFEVLRSPAIGSIAAVGVLLLVIFVAWLMTAQALYQGLFGAQMPSSVSGFLGDVFGTSRGWTLIIAGHALGFLFAAAAFTVGVMAFPLLVDRDVGPVAAVTTSVRAVLANPGTMAIWGVIVAVALMIGSAPLFIGLAVIVPVLGHASWHLYRRVVEQDRS